MGARNRVGTGLSYRLAGLHRLTELISWNKFLGSKKVLHSGPAVGMLHDLRMTGVTLDFPFSTFLSGWKTVTRKQGQQENICTNYRQKYLKADRHDISSLGRYVFGSEISYNKAPPRLPGLGC